MMIYRRFNGGLQLCVTRYNLYVIIFSRKEIVNQFDATLHAHAVPIIRVLCIQWLRELVSL